MGYNKAILDLPSNMHMVSVSTKKHIFVPIVERATTLQRKPEQWMTMRRTTRMNGQICSLHRVTNRCSGRSSNQKTKDPSKVFALLCLGLMWCRFSCSKEARNRTVHIKISTLQNEEVQTMGILHLFLSLSMDVVVVVVVVVAAVVVV
jgi:hypothetical protein